MTGRPSPNSCSPQPANSKPVVRISCSRRTTPFTAPFAKVAAASPLPWLHIAEEVARAAREHGFCRLAITGTRYTMDGPVYPEILTQHGIEYRIPSPLDRARIDQIIFDELVNGIFRSDSLGVISAAISRMKAEGCDAVILGCTELPLLIGNESSPLPVLDSTRLLARAALRRAIAGCAVPQPAEPFAPSPQRS